MMAGERKEVQSTDCNVSSAASPATPVAPAPLARRNRFMTLYPYMLVGLAPGLALVLVKYALLWCCELNFARFRLGQNEFTFLEHMSFYRMDLLVGCLLLPGLILGLAWLVPHRARSICVGLVSVLLLVGLFVELNVYWLLGRFLNWNLLKDAVNWGSQGDDALGTLRGFVLLSPTAAAGFAGLIVISVGLCWLAGRWDRYGHQGSFLRRLTLQNGTALWAMGLVATGAAWLPLQAGSCAQHEGILTRLTAEFLEAGELDTSAFAALTPEELLTKYREMNHAPAPREQRPHWQAAKDCDLLVFVLETAPGNYYPLANDPLADCPNLARLRERSFVGHLHHTTAPVTHRAIFSLLSSWYPSCLPTDYGERPGVRCLPGVMQCLRARGYETAYYATDRFARTHDGPMYEKLGVAKSFYADQASPELLALEANHRCPLPRVCSDRLALRALLVDIGQWTRANKRYACLYAPQIGHGPWPDVSGSGIPAENLQARARAIMKLLDSWLGEILAQCEKAGRLEKTLIVVVGDHGTRNSEEDPAFRAGLAEAGSLRVPLLLYAPAALRTQQDILYLTSHLDVAPSLLDLLGIADGREFEQGSPLWDPRIKDRTTWFWGRQYIAADGFHEKGQFVSLHALNHVAYVSKQMQFDDRDVLDPATPQATELVNRFARTASFQEAWVATLSAHLAK
jgi:hypothetical protein